LWGVVCGIFLYYLWVAVIMAILFAFFTEPTAMGVATVTFLHIIRTWLTAGLLPFFTLSGHCVFLLEEMDRDRTTSG
jgi:hypothetical protein